MALMCSIFDILYGSNAAKMVLGKEQFDVVVAGEVIEHLPGSADALASVCPPTDCRMKARSIRIQRSVPTGGIRQRSRPSKYLFNFVLTAEVRDQVVHSLFKTTSPRKSVLLPVGMLVGMKHAPCRMLVWCWEAIRISTNPLLRCRRKP